MAPRSQTYKQDPDYIKLNKFQKSLYEIGDGILPAKIKDTLDIDLIGSHKKTFYISGWSIVHILTGIIAGYLYLHVWRSSKNYYLTLFGLHTFYEVANALIGVSHPFRLTGRSNGVDTIVDTVMFMSGTYLAKAVYKIMQQ